MSTMCAVIKITPRKNMSRLREIKYEQTVQRSAELLKEVAILSAKIKENISQLKRFRRGRPNEQ